MTPNDQRLAADRFFASLALQSGRRLVTHLMSAKRYSASAGLEDRVRAQFGKAKPRGA